MTSDQGSADGFGKFAERADEGPVVMTNLIRVKPGQESMFRQYMESLEPLVRERGGSYVYTGSGPEAVLGTAPLDGMGWDFIWLVRYPRRGDLLEMVQSEAYAKIAHLRQDSVAEAELHASEPD